LIRKGNEGINYTIYRIIEARSESDIKPQRKISKDLKKGHQTKMFI